MQAETDDVHATDAYGVIHHLPQHYSTLLTFDWDKFPKLVIDREIDEWFDAQRQENDPVKRKELARKIDRKTIEEAWMLPLTYWARTVPLNAKVMGFKSAPTHVLNTDWRGVWLDQ